MEKRVFLAIALSLLVLTLYQAFLAPKPPQPGDPAVAPAADAAAQTAPAAPPATPAPGSVAASPAVTPAADAREIVIDTDRVIAVFNTQGAVLQSFKLKKHLDSYGEPLELVPVSLAPQFAKPFALKTDDAAITAAIAGAVFTPSTDQRSRLELGANSGVVSFDYRDPATGLTVHKGFEFQPGGNPYVINVDASVDVAGVSKPVTIEMGPSVGLGYNETGGRYSYPNAAVLSRTGKVERPKTASLIETPTFTGTFEFAGVGDHYFLSAALPGQKPVTVTYEDVKVPVPWVDPQQRQREFIAYAVTSTGAANIPFYLGPKEFDTLKAVDVQLVRTIDYGMFAFLVVPLLQALKWVNAFVHNYGWSIIALTILINVVLFPLRHRSMVSMRKMQKLQPKVKAIQDRYAKYKVTDPERQKMNTEMMALYRENGVNPASGCVPMLLTLPILFAFYSLLGMSIELRHAPFVGYLTDLSRPDPLYITPVLMGLSMFWQQRMMPSTADPVQQKMFLFMPLIFTFSFLWAPSGLVLYWFCSNLLAIGQQYLTNRITGDARR
jgi:YidC/Oxa1 family membrane protein insertase